MHEAYLVEDLPQILAQIDRTERLFEYYCEMDKELDFVIDEIIDKERNLDGTYRIVIDFAGEIADKIRFHRQRLKDLRTIRKEIGYVLPELTEEQKTVQRQRVREIVQNMKKQKGN